MIELKNVGNWKIVLNIYKSQNCQLTVVNCQSNNTIFALQQKTTLFQKRTKVTIIVRLTYIFGCITVNESDL